MSRYFYARPDRDNWQPVVQKCRRQLLRELLKGVSVEQAEAAMFRRFENVSRTFWEDFWKEVTDIPVEHAFGYFKV